MPADLNRTDVVEKRARCVVCGYVMTYMEYIHGNKCVFHTNKIHVRSDDTFEFYNMTLWQWVRFAIAEYKVTMAKLKMRDKGLSAQDYFGCLGNVAPEIEDIKDCETMGQLFKKLKKYKVAKC